MTLHTKDKEIVIPGQVLAEGLDYLPTDGTLRDKDDIVSEKLGLVSIKGRVIKVIPLVGNYMAKEKDLVIGKVKDIIFSGWLVDIGGPYHAMLPIRETQEYIDKNEDLGKYYDIGDVIFAEISKITRIRNIDLSMKQRGLGKLKGGRIITIIPGKVPRLIGKQGSMINLIKDKTKCKITVGQNGRIWIRGDNKDDEWLAEKAVYMINKESHLEGLTDKITDLLEK